eukprot:14951221-Alexandrium_andersonii.AAC.1
MRPLPTEARRGLCPWAPTPGSGPEGASGALSVSSLAAPTLSGPCCPPAPAPASRMDLCGTARTAL